MSEHMRRTFAGAAIGVVALVIVMLAVTAGFDGAAYAVPVLMVLVMAWATYFGLFGKRGFWVILGAVVCVTLLVALLEAL
jgi:hypothetical protein